MGQRSTNLDVRAYAMERGVRLKDLAKALGITPAEFSIQYMRMEQPEEIKEALKAKIREVSEGK